MQILASASLVSVKSKACSGIRSHTTPARLERYVIEVCTSQTNTNRKSPELFVMLQRREREKKLYSGGCGPIIDHKGSLDFHGGLPPSEPPWNGLPHVSMIHKAQPKLKSQAFYWKLLLLREQPLYQSHCEVQEMACISHVTASVK